MERLKAVVLTVIALVRPMSGSVQRDHSIPCIVVKSLSNCQIVCDQIERLFHVGEAQAWAGVIRLGVQFQKLIDDVIGDGREENSQVRGHILRGVDA